MNFTKIFLAIVIVLTSFFTLQSSGTSAGPIRGDHSLSFYSAPMDSTGGDGDDEGDGGIIIPSPGDE